jgi:hypothetical protein
VVFRRVLPALVLLGIVSSTLPGSGTRAAAPATVVVELFTSEGCSSCPPADALLQRMADAPPVSGVQIVALGEHVDYWDQQGWKDRFSSAALTHRQETYARAFNVESIYTPQMVVDGRAQLVGSDAASARRAIEQAASAPHGTMQIGIEPHGDRVTVVVTAAGLPAIGRGDHPELVLAITEDGLTSDVRRGENHGRVLSHAAVVRQLIVLGAAGGEPIRRDVTMDPSWHRDRVKVIAFAQESRSRQIIAAAAVPLPGAR